MNLKTNRSTRPRTIEVRLGHLIEYRSRDEDWSGLAPGRTRWEATYQIDSLALPAPETGSRNVEVRCRTCGRPVTVRVHSRWALALRYALLAGAAAAGCLFGCMVIREPWGSALIALLSLYVAYFALTNGGADPGQPASLAEDAPAGHQLWGPGEEV